jgi:CubicO group peptidase (beta-lactamase class C family)
VASVFSRIGEIQTALDRLSAQHRVPGASLGVLAGDDYLEWFTGVANLDTGLPVTRDTLFQVGSITKVHTATLVMKLVDDGKVRLDAPVKTYVPEFRLADSTYEDEITVRHLLTHTSGIDGADYFDDFGPGDDAVERFVEALAQLGQIHTPGEMWSYCNAGTVLAGRVIEKVSGLPFRAAFHELLIEPLGLHETSLRVEDMLTRRCAVGHMPGASGPVVTPTPLLPVATAPAGALTVSTPRDLIAFVRMHLDGGRLDGQQFLSTSSVNEMRRTQIRLPRWSQDAEMGVGWMIESFCGERLLKHVGGTVGQVAYLYVLPDRPFAVALLTNSFGGPALWSDLGRWLFTELTGVWEAGKPQPPESPPEINPERYIGCYRRRDTDTEIQVRGGSLVGISTYTGPLQGLGEPDVFTLTPFDEHLFHSLDESGNPGLLEFMHFDEQGQPRFVHSGRVAERV